MKAYINVLDLMDDASRPLDSAQAEEVLCAVEFLNETFWSYDQAPMPRRTPPRFQEPPCLVGYAAQRHADHVATEIRFGHLPRRIR